MPQFDQIEEKKLLLELQQGRESAFTALYNRYWERMVALAFFKLGSAEDAKEVVQDVFVDLWNRRAQLEIQYSFHTYIAAAVKYKILTLIAKKRREEKKQQQLNKNDADTGTEEWLSFRQLRQELEATVLMLPEKCQLVFRMSREEGLSGNEIAERLQVSPKTVEAHLSKALKVIRSSFRRIYFFLI